MSNGRWGARGNPQHLQIAALLEKREAPALVEPSKADLKLVRPS